MLVPIATLPIPYTSLSPPRSLVADLKSVGPGKGCEKKDLISGFMNAGICPNPIPVATACRGTDNGFHI